ncbi:ribose-5-phosphate isomerase B [Lachnospiraceae bacterium]|nr:ribose-5-phosphate isomerase B [Lachnospiraceae bacterium]
MIAIGCDHGGYDLKQKVLEYLVQNQIEYKDFGCYSKDSCDYPMFGQAVAKAVATGACEKGIVICTTGIGISITANKIKGIRCALCSDTVSARLTREHNNANVLALGAGIVGVNLALSIVDTFLRTEFSREEKHCRRVSAIQALEEETMIESSYEVD